MAFPLIALQLGIAVGTWAIGKLLEDKSPLPARDAPGALRRPQAGVGTPIPYTYGDAYVDRPPILWFGNSAVFQHVDGEWNYAGDFFCSLGIPASDIQGDWRTDDPPRLMAIWVKGVRHPLGFGGAGDSGIVHGDEQQVTIELGGTGRGGECVGLVGFLDGRSTQRIGTSLGSVGGSLFLAMERANAGSPLDPNKIPAYRHQLSAYLITSDGHGKRLGESNDVPIGFEVRAYGMTKVLVGATYEANLATALYDMLCARVYKLGLSTSLVDLASFVAAGATLVSEGHGASPVLDDQGAAAGLMLTLLDQINGVIIEDHATGKLKLKLIRDDYDPNAIPLINKNVLIPSGADDIGLEIDFYGWDDVVNELSVEFRDRAQGFETNRAKAQRGAVFSNNGGRLNSKTVKYPAVTSATLAAQLAARELALCSRPLMTAKARVNRTLYAVEIGDAVRMQVTGIVTDKAFRVLDIDHGQLADGVITMTLIEDVFGQTLGAYPPWGGHPPFELPVDVEVAPG